MKYSYDWIQSHIEETLPDIESLKETIIFHAFEVEEVETVGDDFVLDIKVLPDRAGDALSHYGMAREVAGLLKLTLKPLEMQHFDIQERYPVEVQSDLCNRYVAVRINGVSVAPSPADLKQKLESIGQKSISNVVDATNFILNDIGQPTHAFDADKIQGGIIVRLATEGETMTTLSGEEKTLRSSMLVIADAAGVLAIAGVKGGNRAEVTADTKNIVLEVANFDAVSVRKTSRALGLVTDASKRFENNVSPVLVSDARDQLVTLVTMLAGGTVVSSAEHYPHVASARTVTFTLADIIRVLGASITDENIADVFARYHYAYEKNVDAYVLAVPHYRADITGAHDIAEEIGRVIGYDTIPAKALPFVPTTQINTVDAHIAAIRKYLTGKGFSEVMTYSLRKKGEVFIAYGAKDKSALRTNLTDGLRESFELNKLNAPLLGMSEVKVFEIGTVFFQSGGDTKEELHVATADKSGTREWRLIDFVTEHSLDATDTHLMPETIMQPAVFRPWSSYPFVVRDVAVWLPQGDVDAKASLEKLTTDFASAHSVVPATMFDTFSKDGQTSYAYRFVFQATDRTLTDADVATTLAPLTDAIAAIPGATLR